MSHRSPRTVYRQALKRVERRARAVAWFRESTCSNWKRCGHSMCQQRRYHDHLLRQAVRVANDLSR